MIILNELTYLPHKKIDIWVNEPEKMNLITSFHSRFSPPLQLSTHPSTLTPTPTYTHTYSTSTFEIFSSIMLFFKKKI